MTINGIKPELQEMFSNLDVSKIAEKESLERDSYRLITQSNINAEIPNRFSTVRLHEYDTRITEEVMKFATTDNDKIFLLSGSCGVGKTTLMCGAIHERAIKGLNGGYYFSIRNLMPKLRTSRSFSASENEEMLFKRFSNEPFLCLDEVGTCENIAEERNFLRTVIANRYDNQLPTFLATNLDALHFKAFLTNLPPENMDAINKDPIIDRIRSTVIIKALTGESHRG